MPRLWSSKGRIQRGGVNHPGYWRNELNQYTSVGGTSYGYDNNGNLDDDGSYTYTYDCENRLTEVKNKGGGNKTVVKYYYDFAGRRIAKALYKKGKLDATIKYCYDGDQVIAEYDENDNLLRKFVYGPGIDEPIMMIDVDGETETRYYYHFDGLGSVVALSDTSRNIVERYSYDVFGEPNTTSSLGNPYMFTGRRYDSETGFYYYRARYYAYDIGRFLQADPVGYDDGLNLHTYCNNNPTSFVDPYGNRLRLPTTEEAIGTLEVGVIDAHTARECQNLAKKLAIETTNLILLDSEADPFYILYSTEGGEQVDDITNALVHYYISALLHGNLSAKDAQQALDVHEKYGTGRRDSKDNLADQYNNDVGTAAAEDGINIVLGAYYSYKDKKLMSRRQQGKMLEPLPTLSDKLPGREQRLIDELWKLWDEGKKGGLL